MLSFQAELQSGIPIYEQIALAARRAIVSGRLRPGDAFPSVRTLSKEFKINPNTAAKVVAQLLQEGVLESRPGIGTVVAAKPARAYLEPAELFPEIERLVIKAKQAQLSLPELTESITQVWKQLSPNDAGELDVVLMKGEEAK
jgi:GntR family transcriptional regulator